MSEGVDLNPAPDVVLTEYERELVRKVRFGLDMEHFVESDVGQFIFGRAGELESECDVALRTVDPTNLKALVDLQVKARAAGFLKDWLLEVVRIGIEAAREAEQPEE
jgi:hypothetical protein